MQLIMPIGRRTSRLSDWLLLTALVCGCASSAQVVPNRSPLQPNAYNSLPLGAIDPQGWLRKQLEIQAAGLTGHLDEFWKDVGSNSGWLGGTGESWERGPYFLDGLLPLAYELKNPALIKKANRWVEWTLTHQAPSGQIGPASNDDWWPRMVMLKVLTQYAEVSGDSRVVPLMTRYFDFELRALPQRPLQDWGKYRWQDNAYSVLWLYNRTGNVKLLELAKLLHQQGYDWEAQFAHFKYTGKETRASLGLTKGPPPDRAMQTHGVNNGMALKAAPIWYLLSGTSADKAAFNRQWDVLDKYHGLPNGMFSGDEHFAGIDPSQGIELCAVVETMFSLEDAFSILGDATVADRLEKVTYNALPATLSDDLWSHQYDQQPNQIACTRAHRAWSSNNDDSNLFGLEPNFGCCTANLHQGWPKFVSSLFMATPDNGLVTVAYAPSRVRTTVGSVNVEIEEQTDYPFRPSVRFVVRTPKPVSFPLQLRIPAWATETTVTIAAVSASVTDKPFHTIRRTWKDGDTVDVKFAMPVRVSRWFHQAAVVERGPLVFALPVKAEWNKVKSYAEKSADWELKPESKWNYALELSNCQSPAEEKAIGNVPFGSNTPAVTIHVNARQLPTWTVQENSAGTLPESPVDSGSATEDLSLIPYGAAKLRITAFPVLKEKAKCGS